MKTQLVRKNFNNCLIYIIIIISISLCNNYIVFPIKIKNELKQINENINTASSYIDYIKNNQLATYFFIGEPPTVIEIYLTLERLDFLLGEGFCISNSNSNYNYSLSTSFKKSKSSFFSPTYINGFLSNENILLYNNLNLSSNISFKNMNFISCNPSKDIFDVIDEKSICGYIGLQISSSSEYFEWNSIIFQLKSEGFINNQKWSIILNEKIINNYDGALVLGIKEEEYNNIFHFNNEYKTIYSLNTFSNGDYEIKFDEIYYEINNQNYSFNKFIQGMFILDYDYIISNEDYFTSIKSTFFNKYLEKGICFIDKQSKYKKTKKSDMQILNIIFCEKNKIDDEFKNFPKLKLKHVGLYQIFEFDFEDLFQESKKYFIFKILLDEENKRMWNFGRIFLKKYQFVFDNDQKAIYYLGRNNPQRTEESEKDIQIEQNSFNNKSFVFIVLAILIILIAIAIGLFLGKKLFNKNKKKRANELDDDYEYIEKSNNKNEGIGIKFDDNE